MPVARASPVASVVAFLFARPTSSVADEVHAERAFLDARSGDTWDLFLPGWSKGAQGGDPWTFDDATFVDALDSVAQRADGAWAYSGLADLVLFGAIVPPMGPIEVDWANCLSAQIDGADLPLAVMVERITQDIRAQVLDPDFGLPELFADAPTNRPPIVWRDVLISAVISLGTTAAGPFLT